MPSVDDVDLTPPAPGHNLPPRAFTSRAIFELEERAIFAKSWVHVGDVCDIPAPGDYFATQIGTTPVLLVRDRAGVLRGFLNACRHRGTQLLEGKGACDKQIKCSYHAWSYGLDGRLHGVPHREEFAHCDTSASGAMGLVPVRVGVHGPLIFACLDPLAVPFAEWIGELGTRDLPTTLAWELTYELEANWKIFVENANDGYHIQFVHDLLNDALVADSGVTTLEEHGAYTVAMIDPKYVPEGYDASEAKIRFGHVFPNLIPVMSPSDMTYIRVDPVAEDRLRLHVRSYDWPEFSDFREFRKISFQHTTKQDIAVVLKTMRGLRAHGLPAGVHCGTLEERIGHFERTWAGKMSDAVGGEPAKRLAIAR